MGWTGHRKIAEGRHWFTDRFDWDGPACYELGLGGPRGGDILWVYVGETLNERARIRAYASHGSHLNAKIDQALRNQWSLFYRALTMRSKKAAKAMQDRLLEVFVYEWNRQRRMPD